MATIRAYTTIEQSRKLAEILPIESADMEYLAIKETGTLIGSVPFVKDDYEVEDSAYSHIYDRIACWSLAALLSVLPNKLQIALAINDFQGDRKEKYVIGSVEHDRYDCYADNPIDACVEMIEKLHELKML